jgi:chemotaxis protein methyltransferase CheR
VVNDADCVDFLQWALPQMDLRWAGFRRVRRQVCKRLHRRLGALRLADTAAYRIRLEQDPDEWKVLDGLCRISVSRFFRDREVWHRLDTELLPMLLQQATARGAARLRIWSVGCASGEEAYSMALMLSLGDLRPRPMPEIMATDTDQGLLQRARIGCYAPSSLRELPKTFHAAFESSAGRQCLKPEIKRLVRLMHQDLRHSQPRGHFDLIFCRNLAFTYFSPTLQLSTARQLIDCLVPGGLLLLGAHESLPPSVEGVEALQTWLYRRPTR